MISNHHGRKSYPSKRILNLNTWSQLNSISMFFSLGNASQFHLYFHFAVRSSLRKHQKRAFLFNFASLPSLFSIFASFLFLSRLAFAPSGYKKVIKLLWVKVIEVLWFIFGIEDAMDELPEEYLIVCSRRFLLMRGIIGKISPRL